MVDENGTSSSMQQVSREILLTQTPPITTTTRNDGRHPDECSNDDCPHLSHLQRFSKRGVRLSYILNDFVESCGGKEALEGKTSTEISTFFIKPPTEDTSYCDMLFERQECPPNDTPMKVVDRADVFISHAWEYQFLDVLNALKHHFSDEPDIIVWFDLFSNNQHKAPELPYEWWTTVFKTAIADFGRTVMVVDSWKNPKPYTRAWCVFEVYCTVKTDSTFEIAMTTEERDDFLKETLANPQDTIDAIKGGIDAEKSTSFVPADKEHIFEVIRNEVGFSKINALLFQQMRFWILDETHKVHDMFFQRDEKKDKVKAPSVSLDLRKSYFHDKQRRSSDRSLIKDDLVSMLEVHEEEQEREREALGHHDEFRDSQKTVDCANELTELYSAYIASLM
jgi:hypothetical protein